MSFYIFYLAPVTWLGLRFFIRVSQPDADAITAAARI